MSTAATAHAKYLEQELIWREESEKQRPRTYRKTIPPPTHPASEGKYDWRTRLAPNSSLKKPEEKYTRRTFPPFVETRPGEPFFSEIETYREKFLPLLAAEKAEEESELRRRLSTWPVPRLREEGYCLTGLSAFWLEQRQFGRPVAAFIVGAGLHLPENRFENGTQVLVSRLDPLRETPGEGNIVSRTQSQIRIAFQSEKFDLEGHWRLDLGQSMIAYERMRAAVNNMHSDPAVHEASRFHSGKDLVAQGTHLRETLLRGSQPANLRTPIELNANGISTPGAFQHDQRIQSWAARYSVPNPVKIPGDPELDSLNASQIRAVAMMIGEKVSLVQGPPGTGKTKTIIETVKLLRLHFQVPHPLLVCTYTNVAVDNLVEGIAASGLAPLRVGFGGKVKDALMPHTLETKLSQHPLQSRMVKLREDHEDLKLNIKELSSKVAELKEKLKDAAAGSGLHARAENMRARIIQLEKRVKAVRARMYRMEQEMLQDVVNAADVVCTTCITSASASLNVIDFPVVFLDEASMSTEPASLIPLMKGSRHVALIGDHKQLPPVITSLEAQTLGLGVSLFERLTDENCECVPTIMLDVQYRMHPAISRFPSEEFYNFSLRNGTVDGLGNISPALLPPSSRHLLPDEAGNRPSVIFLDHAGNETLKDRSRVNINEGYIIASVVEDLLLSNPSLLGKDIGIIAPYVAQISLLTRLFNTDAKLQARFRAVLGDQRAMQLPFIEIKTVDGFEGREKEIIIFSTVRNNNAGNIGFLADRRRLNVGLTRAKRGLFVVGSISTLKMGKSAEAVSAAADTDTDCAAADTDSPPTDLKPELSDHVTKLKVKEKQNRGTRMSKGAESWKRYAQFLNDEGLVFQLTGEALGVALYGNLPKSHAYQQQPVRVYT